MMAPNAMQAIFDTLGLRVLERGWLSANNIVFAGTGQRGAAVVDTGYARHAEQTRNLILGALGGEPLRHIINTHLHSDHCGGNALLQADGDVHTRVPSVSFEAVRQWSAEQLTYRATGQRCDRFLADAMLTPGEPVALGPAEWRVVAAPGHDPDAVMLFQPDTRVLISGDALWQHRLAIIFPELIGADGFGPAEDTLRTIESLQPAIVIPGHGAPFDDAPAAIEASRRRLRGFVQQPARHALHACRALAMFHLMANEACTPDTLAQWIADTSLMQAATKRLGPAPDAHGWHTAVVASLIVDRVIALDADGWLRESPARAAHATAVG